MFLTVCGRSREPTSPISQTADKMENTFENAPPTGPEGPAGLHPDPPVQSAPEAGVASTGAADVEALAGGRPPKRPFEHFAAPGPEGQGLSPPGEVCRLTDTLLQEIR